MKSRSNVRRKNGLLTDHVSLTDYERRVKSKWEHYLRERYPAHHALKPPGLVSCPQCHELRLPHQVCPSCGSYRGVEVIEIKEKKKKSE
jgi:large subunit ribosomal protein L32